MDAIIISASTLDCSRALIDVRFYSSPVLYSIDGKDIVVAKSYEKIFFHS